MKILVTGGRDYDRLETVARVLGALKVTAIAHGGARGADSLAGKWATQAQIPVHEYHAEWDLYDKAAGPIRNQAMLEEFEPDLVVAFEGNRGTHDMIKRAVAAHVPVLQVLEGDSE